MSATIPAAFPFIEVKIDTSALTPVAQRSPGVIAIVGKTAAGAAGGTADVNKPFAIDTLDQAVGLFAQKNTDGTVAETPLYSSLKIALLQDPKPSKIYGVKVDGDSYAAALASLEAADDVTFVSLANEADVGAPASPGNPSATPPVPATAATNLNALKEHIETMSAQGQKRIGVAMVNTSTAKSNTYVDTITTTVDSLKSSSSRMVMIAARGATGDAATAAMAAIAGFDPQVSVVLKKVRGFAMPVESQYSPSEIKGLSEAGIIPIIDPALIVGESLHFAEGRCFTTDASLLYIDIVRVLDDIDFRLKAGLIGAVGDARITKSGMTMLKTRVEGILGPLQRSGVIVDFAIDIPVLNILSVPETAWTATDRSIVQTARTNRIVDLFVSVTYGPAVHLLKVTLSPKF
ncbi:hypothetical protein C7B80_12985 [Cyanosarcina cf. burmensis CCALA 770]|nr:hypothetical protein C7B80_12985 [Cyanosarcina cf. burmensis CCALA 770]